jgi:LPXTG-site transpeptidase (sortase) family protein
VAERLDADSLRCQKGMPVSRSTRRYWLRWLFVPPVALGLVIFRGGAAVNDLRKRVQASLASRFRGRPQWVPSYVPQGSELLAQITRERIVKMIAVAVFAIASQSVIASLAGGQQLAAARTAPILSLERAPAPAPRDVGPLLTINLSTDPDRTASGGTATYTIGIQHTVGTEQTATDLVVTDILPPEVELASRPVCSFASQDPEAQCSYDPAKRAVTARTSSLNGSSAAMQVAFVVRVHDSVECGKVIGNTAAVSWNDMVDGPSQSAAATSEIAVGDGPDGGCGTPLPGGTATSAEPSSATDQPAPTAYSDPGIYMDIPRLGLDQLEILRVPAAGGTWDISGLGAEGGWLDTTAMPGGRGNSVIAGRGIDLQGQDGPFAQLEILGVGDQIMIRTPGDLYTYAVQSVRIIAPTDHSVLDESGLPILTLLAPSQPNQATQTYDARVVVQAVLVKQGQ